MLVYYEFVSNSQIFLVKFVIDNVVVIRRKLLRTGLQLVPQRPKNGKDLRLDNASGPNSELPRKALQE